MLGNTPPRRSATREKQRGCCNREGRRDLFQVAHLFKNLDEISKTPVSCWLGAWVIWFVWRQNANEIVHQRYDGTKY